MLSRFFVITLASIVFQASCFKNSRLRLANIGSHVQMNDGDVQTLVEQRILHRNARDYDSADNIKSILEAQGIEITDIALKAGGGSTWTRVIDKRLSTPELEICGNKYTSLVEFAHDCYNRKTLDSISEAEIFRCTTYFLSFSMAETEMHSQREEGPVVLLSRSREMQGRKFADVAFEFSMAGVQSADLYKVLSSGARSELERWGRRESCRAIFVCQFIEKLACAGVTDQTLFSFAADLLSGKDWNPSTVADLRSGNYSLLSDRPLLSLWRFAAKQRKHGKQSIFNDGGSDCKLPQEAHTFSGDTLDTLPESGLRPLPNLASLFDNPQLPLVIDLGCGFGVSLIGLANISTGLYNCLGCDMSGRATVFANGISCRWGINGRCAFVVSDAAGLIDAVKRQYPGAVSWILINFPTPYKFELAFNDADWDDAHEDEEDLIAGGNAQLPSQLSEFMVSEGLIESCRELLGGRPSKEDEGNASGSTSTISEDHSASRGSPLPSLPRCLLLQTNVEDVAVMMRRLVESSSAFGCPGGFSSPESAKIAAELWSMTEAAAAESRLLGEMSTPQPSLVPAAAVPENESDWKAQESMTQGLESSLMSLQVSSGTESHATAASSSDGNSVSAGSATDGTGSSGSSSNSNSYSNSGIIEDGEDGWASEPPVITRRQRSWVAAGGARAAGPGFLRRSILPTAGRTETEVACAHEGKPVHRILFQIVPEP